MKKYSKIQSITVTEDFELPNISPKKTHKKKISDRFEEVNENVLYSIIGNRSSHRFSINEDDTENGFGDSELLLERNKSRLDINDFYPHENSPIPMVAAVIII